MSKKLGAYKWIRLNIFYRRSSVVNIQLVKITWGENCITQVWTSIHNSSHTHDSGAANMADGTNGNEETALTERVSKMQEENLEMKQKMDEILTLLAASASRETQATPDEKSSKRKQKSKGNVTHISTLLTIN